MNEINTGMAELHQKVLNLQKDGLAPTKSTEAEVEKKPNFVDAAKGMFTREKIKTGFVKITESFFKTLNEHPIEVSFAVVGSYVAAVTGGLLLFAR